MKRNANLEVKNLCKNYGTQKAIQDIQLSVGPGIFGLLGPNGAGKSTLMNILATTLKPTAGSAFFSGQEIQEHPDFIRNQLGFLPQDFGFYPRTKAKKMLDYIAILKGIPSKKKRSKHIDELLSLTNLTAHAKRSVDTFSGGMKQRLGLAQALMGDPKLLILDEPSTGLDPYERNHFQRVLSERAEDCVVILSTHLVADVDNLCSQIMILNQGKSLYVGQPGKLIQSFDGKIHRVPLNQFQRDQGILLHQRFYKGTPYIHFLSPELKSNYVPDLEDVYFAVLAGGLS